MKMKATRSRETSSTLTKSVNVSHFRKLLDGPLRLTYRYKDNDRKQDKVLEDGERRKEDYLESETNYEATYAKRVTRFVYAEIAATRTVTTSQVDNAEERIRKANRFSGKIFYRLRSWYLSASYTRGIRDYSDREGQDIENKLELRASP